MHLKKNLMSKTWPVPRKGKRKRFVAVPSHSKTSGISVLYLLRDVLGIVRTRKEAKYMTLNGMVKVNNVTRKDENFPVRVFDVFSLEKSGKDYRIEIVNKKFSLTPISSKDVGTKIVKISGKKVLGKNKTQMNLEDGRNFLAKDNFSIGDSVIVDTRENKIVEILPIKEGATVEIIGGKHAGDRGEIVGFEQLARSKVCKIKFKEKGIVDLPYKTLLVIK